MCFVNSEYGILRKVILSEPKYLKIMKPINEIQKKHEKNNINSKIACEEHKSFVEALQQNGVEVILTKPHEMFPNSVNTRDIGVTTPQGLVFGRFYSPYRWGEHRLVEQTLDDLNININEKFNTGTFEGGDFMYVDRNLVAVGMGIRTDAKGINNIRKVFSNIGVEVITVEFEEKFLHLDMIMNVIDDKTAVICKAALPKKIIELLLSKNFTLINVEEKDVFLHKCNLLSIGNKTIISHRQARSVNEKLEDLGYKILELDLVETLKSGGGPRCMSFPLLRDRV